MKRLKEANGQVLVMTALSITVLLGFIAFATDVGLLLRERRMVQTAADSAAIAGAAESLYEGTPDYVTTGMWSAASGDSAFNGFTAGASNGSRNGSTGTTLKINVSPNITIPGFNSGGYVQAVLTQTTPTFFMNMFGFHNMDVTVTAIASNSLQSDGCIYVQNDNNYASPPSGYAVDMNGHSLIASPNCGMTVNGSIDMSGSSTIDAKFVTASGTITGGEPGWSNAPAPPDPLPQLQLDENKPTPGSPCNLPAGSGMTRCVYNFMGGNLNGKSTPVTLIPGTLYYFDVPVTISGNVSDGTQIGANGLPVSGTGGVSIYLAGTTPYLNFNHIGALTLSAPTCADGTFCSILLDAPLIGSNGSGTYNCSAGNGNNGGNPGEIYFDFGSSRTNLNGILYAPYMQLFVQDQGASTSLNTDLVIGNICSQSGNLNVNGYSSGNSPITRVGLVY